MFVLMDTSALKREVRPYMPLLLEAIGECPIDRNGTLVSYEDVVAEIEADTIAVSTRMGFDGRSRFSCGSYTYSANLMLQVNITFNSFTFNGINYFNLVVMIAGDD